MPLGLGNIVAIGAATQSALSLLGGSSLGSTVSNALNNMFGGAFSSSSVQFPTIDTSMENSSITNRSATEYSESPDTNLFQTQEPSNFQNIHKRDEVSKFLRSAPEVVQVNQFPFSSPRSANVTLQRADGNGNISKYYEYDYTSDWTSDPRGDIRSKIKAKLAEIRKYHNILIGQSKKDLLDLQAKTYNRYKVPITALTLDKTFGHIFIVKPNCNVCNSMGQPLTFTNDYKRQGQSAIGSDPESMSILAQNPKLVCELCADEPDGRDDKFSLLLSNRAVNIQINDESISTKEYGDSWYGYKNVFGKAWTGRDPGTVSIGFMDDRFLSCYNVVRLWMMYIDKVYHGVWGPSDQNRVDKIIDYATAIYYVLTGEDGTRVIFWSKLVGVFPTSANSSALSGNLRDQISHPEISVTFQYAFKIDMDPLSIVEFNQTSGAFGQVQYIDHFNREYGISNPSFVGAPFISKDKDPLGNVQFNLRFRPANVPMRMYEDA